MNKLGDLVINVTQKTIKGGLLSIGLHLCVIFAVAMSKWKQVYIDAAGTIPAWLDETPQIAVTFKNESGQIINWYNMKGYVNQKDYEEGGTMFGKTKPAGHQFVSSFGHDEQYLVNTKTKMRVENPAKSAECHRIFGEFCADAGIEVGSSSTVAELCQQVEGAEIGVMVRSNGRGTQVEVHYTCAASQAAEVEVEG
jgi:hypothetical protein